MKSFSLLCTVKQRGIPSKHFKNPEENRAMKERIYQIMQREKMSQKDFAAALGISQASLSSIFNGRTLPTNRHVEAIHKCFPDISVNWIMFGEGEMLAAEATLSGATATPSNENVHSGEGVRQDENVGTLFDFNSSESGDSLPAGGPYPGPVVIREIVKYTDKPQRRIREIQVIYDDGILETFVQKPDK